MERTECYVIGLPNLPQVEQRVDEIKETASKKRKHCVLGIVCSLFVLLGSVLTMICIVRNEELKMTENVFISLLYLFIIGCFSLFMFCENIPGKMVDVVEKLNPSEIFVYALSDRELMKVEVSVDENVLEVYYREDSGEIGTFLMNGFLKGYAYKEGLSRSLVELDIGKVLLPYSSQFGSLA